MCVCLLAAFMVVGASPAGQTASPIKADERVVFFPTFGHLDRDRAAWVVAIHGWIFEPEEDSLTRGAGLALFREFLELDEEDAVSAIFNQRARAFLVDNERDKRMAIRLGDREFAAGVSDIDGHFTHSLRIDAETVDSWLRAAGTRGGWVDFEAVVREPGARKFTGSIQFIEETGVTVISDIDDTIKISEVTDRQALVMNTFLLPFKAVPGMAELYTEWANRGVCFHYVSACPWQLYEHVAAFMRSAGFPSGSLHLKRFRLKDSSVVKLFASPEALKLKEIESILEVFPRRRFVLVGDSGEKDPEVYGQLARSHPDQVIRILIRDVTGGQAEPDRFDRAFADVPPERWTVFREADELGLSVP
ncbi:MAG: App1 family protein [bacterium]|nr:App1 family protein [bacterium]